MKTYTQIKYGEYEDTEQSVTLRANGGDCGGGSETLIVQRVYDVSRRHNYPEFKDVCETIQAYYGGGA